MPSGGRLRKNTRSMLLYPVLVLYFDWAVLPSRGQCKPQGQRVPIERSKGKKLRRVKMLINLL